MNTLSLIPVLLNIWIVTGFLVGTYLAFTHSFSFNYGFTRKSGLNISLYIICIKPSCSCIMLLSSGIPRSRWYHCLWTWFFLSKRIPFAVTQALSIFRTVIAMVTVNHWVGLQHCIPEQLVFLWKFCSKGINKIKYITHTHLP